MTTTRVDAQGLALAFHDGVKNQDPVALASHYHENAKLLPPNMPICEGRAAIQAAFRLLMDAGVCSLDLETVEIRDEGAVSIEYGRYTLGIEPPGAAPVTDTGKYIVVHETRPDGPTKILYDIFNSDLAPAGYWLSRPSATSLTAPTGGVSWSRASRGSSPTPRSCAGSAQVTIETWTLDGTADRLVRITAGVLTGRWFQQTSSHGALHPRGHRRGRRSPHDHGGPSSPRTPAMHRRRRPQNRGPKFWHERL
ncbi:MAG: YybH family protein [Acidimicrobiales bacterium]